MLKVVLAALAGAAAVVSATSAEAAIIKFNVSGVFSNGAVLGGSFEQDSSNSPSFQNIALTVGNLPVFNFDTSGSQGGGVTTINFSNSANNTLTLSGPNDPNSFNFASGGGQFNTNSSVTYGGSRYSLVTGSFNVAPSVPEPATWAMMMLGFGAVGYAMRRKNKVAARIRLA